MYSFIYVYGGIGLKGCSDVDVLNQCRYLNNINTSMALNVADLTKYNVKLG